MNNSLILIDYDFFTYDNKDFLRGIVYSKQTKSLHKVVGLANSEIVDTIDNLLYQDVTSYVTYKLKRDGSISLTFDYK